MTSLADGSSNEMDVYENIIHGTADDAISADGTCVYVLLDRKFNKSAVTVEYGATSCTIPWWEFHWLQ